MNEIKFLLDFLVSSFMGLTVYMMLLSIGLFWIIVLFVIMVAEFIWSIILGIKKWLSPKNNY